MFIGKKKGDLSEVGDISLIFVKPIATPLGFLNLFQENELRIFEI